MKKGGYIIIDLQSASIVNDLRKALDSNKPVLVYDANNDANFYTLTYASGTYTLTGAKDSYSVASDGTITITGTQLHKYVIYLLLVNADNDNIDCYFQLDTNKELPLYNNETLTEEIANSIIDDYNGIIFVDSNNEKIQGFVESKFSSDKINTIPSGDMIINSNSKITITKLF